MELRVSQLKKNSLDKPILAELGDKAETTLSAIWELLTKQPNGESGVLLTNGYANIFYVRDAKGVLWAVGARWSSGGWYVCASSVEGPGGWNEGSQVFSRNS
jgi:predicted metal-dependent peptidase